MFRYRVELLYHLVALTVNNTVFKIFSCFLEVFSKGWKEKVPSLMLAGGMLLFPMENLCFSLVDFLLIKESKRCIILDTKHWEWCYISESGVLIPERNSHSMAILTNPVDQESYIVIYGGASPEQGPLGDTYYALLPSNPSLIG
jgi:hypothetical protein